MCSLWGPNLKLYNNAGERFMVKYDPVRMENTTRDIAARAGYTEITEGRGTPRGGIVVDPTGNDRALLPQYQASLYHVYSRARKIFGPEVANWEKSFEATPSQHFFMGGIMIDDTMKTDMPGLFAVGEAAGGMHGANRLSGTALTEIFIFGDLAGKVISEWIKKNDAPGEDRRLIRREVIALEEAFAPKGKDDIRPFEVKKAVKEVMWSLLGPVRDRKGMATAMAKLEDLCRNHVGRMRPASGVKRYNKERMELCDTRSMATTALLVARSAHLREESRGSHYVRDYPFTDNDRWLRNIILQRGKDGEPVVTYNEIEKDIEDRVSR
jgi:succinate dehydrogenase/fumarate reductase flavoprotein subunit